MPPNRSLGDRCATHTRGTGCVATTTTTSHHHRRFIIYLLWTGTDTRHDDHYYNNNTYYYKSTRMRARNVYCTGKTCDCNSGVILVYIISLLCIPVFARLSKSSKTHRYNMLRLAGQSICARHFRHFNHYSLHSQWKYYNL
jgi:hypothetical protein